MAGISDHIVMPYIQPSVLGFRVFHITGNVNKKTDIKNRLDTKPCFLAYEICLMDL
jgi:hypothetical protein